MWITAFIFDDFEKCMLGCVSLKILNIISEIFKTIISILVPTCIMYYGLVISGDNLIISFVFAILVFCSIWFVLNYTLPEWVVCLIVYLFIRDIYLLFIKNIRQSQFHIHYPIRSKQRRFIRR